MFVGVKRMAIIKESAGVLDERLHSEEFRKKLLASPVLIKKQKQANELVKALPKSAKK